MSSTLGNTSPVLPPPHAPHVGARALDVEARNRGRDTSPGGDDAGVGRDPCEGVRIGVLLPCRNEAAAIGNVVRAFRTTLPSADVYVYDNASTDETAEIARSAGAIVREAPQPGKGNVIRRMFAEIDADVYVLADGDDTYEADAAPRLIAELRDHSLDMVVGRRIEGPDAAESYRPGHRVGNRVLTGIVRRLFGATCNDMLSGYRVFSHRYVKSFPAFSKGFETETEMTVHALDLMMPIREVDTDYRMRPDESSSKLRTVRDGVRILRFIIRLFKEYEPVRFFGVLALVSGILAGLFAARGSDVLPVRLSGQLAIALAGLGIVLASAGLILDTVSRSRREMKRIMYLALPYGPHQVEPARPASTPRPAVLHNGTGSDWSSVRRRMGA
jgi:glycosyltransferase involved in cell wall biosynthesis